MNAEVTLNYKYMKLGHKSLCHEAVALLCTELYGTSLYKAASLCYYVPMISLQFHSHQTNTAETSALHLESDFNTFSILTPMQQTVKYSAEDHSLIKKVDWSWETFKSRNHLMARVPIIKCNPVAFSKFSNSRIQSCFASAFCPMQKAIQFCLQSSEVTYPF